MKKFRNGKLVIVGLLSLVIGVAGTVGVFAAIPDSNTKVITACRNNLSGALRVIDAQSGATCNFLETSLSWSGDLTPPSSGAKTAVVYLDTNRLYEPAYSRGVVNLKHLVQGDSANNPDDLSGYCLDLGFTVRYSTDARPEGAVSYPAIIGGPEQIDHACGAGFDAFIDASMNSTRVFFFSE